MGDWFSRRILAWRVSIIMEAEFFIEALEEVLAKLPSNLQMHSLPLSRSPADGVTKNAPWGSFGVAACVDCAAAMESLDLVVTSDTAIAHLAGALGRPVFLALKRVPDWRWLMDSEDCPWYPGMRLFRQAEKGEWEPVFKRIASNVAACLTKKTVN